MMHAATHTNVICNAFIYQEFEMDFHASSETPEKKTMASSKFLVVIHNISLLHFLFCLLPTTLSQTGGNLPPGPSIAECGPYLLPLTSCGPFVQGRVPLPALQCCINLSQLYTQQATCLCLLLNTSTFPINSTLALLLPIRCSLQIDTSICSVPQPPSLPPTSQLSTRTSSNSTIAASPAVIVEPRMPGLIGFGFQRSSGVNINLKDSIMVVILSFIILGLLLL